MPIRASEKARYPKDWKAISQRIKDRAQGRCECVEECGLHPWGRCVERDRHKAFFAKGKIIFTVAHLDHQPENCADENLKAMCQRCHLRYDRHHHAETARETRARKSGQILFPATTEKK
jgi:hypothetical protein